MAKWIGNTLVSVIVFWFAIGSDIYDGKKLADKADKLYKIESRTKAPKSSSLPVELEYLQSVVNQLNADKDYEYDEYSKEIVVPLKAALTERVSGLNSENAEKLLLDDYKDLASWLKHPELVDSQVYVISSFFFEVLIEEDVIDAINDYEPI